VYLSCLSVSSVTVSFVCSLEDIPSIRGKVLTFFVRSILPFAIVFKTEVMTSIENTTITNDGAVGTVCNLSGLF
jgi:hypothetical protein